MHYHAGGTLYDRFNDEGGSFLVMLLQQRFDFGEEIIAGHVHLRR